jgi:hypothetical protein
MGSNKDNIEILMREMRWCLLKGNLEMVMKYWETLREILRDENLMD